MQVNEWNKKMTWGSGSGNVRPGLNSDSITFFVV